MPHQRRKSKRMKDVTTQLLDRFVGTDPRQLEEHYRRRKEEPANNTYARKLSLQSLMRIININQLKEEITRFDAHSGMKSYMPVKNLG